MTDEYTRAVLLRADQLRTGEAALSALDERSAHQPAWRAWLAAAVAALAMLYPSISAAAAIL